MIMRQANYKKRAQFNRLCNKVKTFHQYMRLWNWADHRIDPEIFWNILHARCNRIELP
jgi:hypothetical protein